MFYLIPISLLAIAFVLKRIKKEDRSLFEQLKANGYSSWSFYPKDRMKIAFVPIFSISFLIISWVIIWLIKLTL